MKQKRLEQVRDFFKKYKRLPSYSEMLAIFQLSSKNAIHKIVKKWLAAGLLEKINNKLCPTQKFFRLPFLGYVKAGFPSEASEDLEFLSLDDYLVDKPQSSFLLKVTSDSLIGIGILPGDLVIIERKVEANPENIVLALIDGRWTLKIFRKEAGKVSLESANDNYPPFYPTQELQIFGVVKGVIRKIK